MSILVGAETRLLVQGITGKEGSFHAQRSIEYGTRVVAGVTPGQGGQTALLGEAGVPVFDTVKEAVGATGANCSLIFVPAPAAADAILEAAEAGISVIVCITEGVPTLDMMMVRRKLGGTGTRVIGPNCPGVITPGQARVGIMPGDVFLPGPVGSPRPSREGRGVPRVGVISRSGTLVYEAVAQLSALGVGQSTCVGLGGDPIPGTRMVEILRLFDEDPATDAVVLIGEIGGVAEQEAAEHIRGMAKPVIAFIAGATAPPGRRMGHAGAIIEGAAGTAQGKKQALRAAGAVVVDSPALVGETTRRVLAERGLL